MRQLAIRYLGGKLNNVLCTRDVFLSMTNGADFGPQAARILSTIDKVRQTREQREIDQEIGVRLDARKDPFPTNTLFAPNRVLWDTKRD